MDKHIYLRADLVQTAPMVARIEARAEAGAGVEGSSLLGRLLLCELALTASFFSAPAHGQTMERVSLVGRVEARCSAVTVAGSADLDSDQSFSRALTVRCSGPRPALSIRARAAGEPEIMLTVATADGANQRSRLSTQEGNVVLDMADLRTIRANADGSRDPVEIVVSPAL